MRQINLNVSQMDGKRDGEEKKGERIIRFFCKKKMSCDFDSEVECKRHSCAWRGHVCGPMPRQINWHEDNSFPPTRRGRGGKDLVAFLGHHADGSPVERSQATLPSRLRIRHAPPIGDTTPPFHRVRLQSDRTFVDGFSGETKGRDEGSPVTPPSPGFRSPRPGNRESNDESHVSHRMYNFNTSHPRRHLESGRGRSAVPAEESVWGSEPLFWLDDSAKMPLRFFR